jgi:hypothetical protein
MDLYQFLFGGDIFTPVENATGLPPLYLFLITIAYISILLIFFQNRAKLKEEYVPLLFTIIILFELLMGELHDPMISDQFGYMKGAEILFWDRPLYIWLTFYLRYYGMLLLNLILFLGIILMTIKICDKKGINKEYVLLTIIGNPFMLFHVYWIFPEILVTFLAFALYYFYELGLEKMGFILNILSFPLKISSVLLTLPISYLFFKQRKYLPILGLGFSVFFYFGLKHIFLADSFFLYNPTVIDTSPKNPIVNILNSLGNYILMLSPLVFFLPWYVKKVGFKKGEYEKLVSAMTLLLLAGVAVNYDYYWRYFLPLIPFYALKAPEIIGNKKELFKVLIFLNFIIVFPILAIWT